MRQKNRERDREREIKIKIWKEKSVIVIIIKKIIKGSRRRDYIDEEIFLFFMPNTNERKKNAKENKIGGEKK